MLWDCLTCYQCQEHCPQNVEVTDILFQLKNLAVENAMKADKEGRAVEAFDEVTDTGAAAEDAEEQEAVVEQPAE
jgi:heterodisulfide reductase subunit C